MNKFDFYRLDAVDQIEMVDGDHSEKIEQLEEKVDNDEKTSIVINNLNKINCNRGLEHWRKRKTIFVEKGVVVSI